MPLGSLLKWHVFTLNLVGFVGILVWLVGWFFCTIVSKGGMGLYVKCKLQHQERKRNIQEESESSEGSTPVAPSLTAPK